MGRNILHEGYSGLVVISLKAKQLSSKNGVLLDISPTQRYRQWVGCEGGPKSTGKHGGFEFWTYIRSLCPEWWHARSSWVYGWIGRVRVVQICRTASQPLITEKSSMKILFPRTFLQQRSSYNHILPPPGNPIWAVIRWRFQGRAYWWSCRRRGINTLTSHIFKIFGQRSSKGEGFWGLCAGVRW